jgi:hypothetical protein
LKKHPKGCFFDASGEGARRLRVLRWDSKAGAMCERSEHREARPERLVSEAERSEASET